MNRRSVLRNLLVAAVASQVDIEATIDSLISDSAHLSDGDFVTYMTYQMRMYISNPSQCAIITNIGED